MFMEKLASLYDEYAGPPGIPWAGLAAKGHEITAKDYDAAYLDLMLQESFKFFDVLGGLSQEFRDKYRTIENAQARKSMTRMMSLVDQTGSDVWQAVKSGDLGATVSLPKSIAVDVFATLAAYAQNGAYLHFDGVIEAAMLAGKITPDEVMAHANSVMKTYQTFIDLDKNGHLDDFKPGKASAGVGFLLPVLTIPWLILGVVAVTAIAYLIYVFEIAAPVQNKVFEWCDKLSSKPGTSDEDLRACVAAATSMAERGNGGLGNFMGDLLKPIATVLGIGIAIYVGSLVLPGILKKATA